MTNVPYEFEAPADPTDRDPTPEPGAVPASGSSAAAGETEPETEETAPSHADEEESQPGAATDGRRDTGERDTVERDAGERDAVERDTVERDTGEGDASEGDASEGDASESGELESLETLEDMLVEEARRLTAERDEYLDSLRRLQADFDNFRKRVLRQQTDLLERASEGLVLQLLPVLDALDLAVAHNAVARDDVAAVEEGQQDAREALVQIGALLRDTLAREGVERIDQVGVEFDPTVHDAVAHEALGDDEVAGGEQLHQQVCEVLRAGYRLKGRVIRPAMVKVRG